MKIILITFALLSQFFCFAQFNNELYDSQLDSILQIQESENKLDGLHNLSWEVVYQNISYADSVITIFINESKKSKNDTQTANAYKIRGVILDETGDWNSSVDSYLQAIDYYKKSKDTLGIAKSEGNIGMVYRKMNQPDEALGYFKSCYVVFKEKNFGRGQLIALSNIGLCYSAKMEKQKALNTFIQAKQLMDSLKFEDSNVYGNLGNGYLAINNYSEAIKWTEKAIEVLEKKNDNRGLLSWLTNIGIAYYDIGDDKKAITYFERALESISEDKVDQNKLILLDYIAKSYYREGKFKSAAEKFSELDKLRNSLYNQESFDQISEMKEKYESEKKELEISNLNNANSVERLKREKEESKVRYFIWGAIIVGVLFIFVVYSLIQKARDNKRISNRNLKIEAQKKDLQEKNDEILASITYAKRIQNAILPRIKIVKSYLADSFILYEPKDIVAGDFYWLESKDDIIFFAAADCTGHGVPGAMVSVVCNNGLNRSVREYGLTDPAAILNKTREIVIGEFEKSDEDVKDGMDIALCSLKGNVLSYSGAHNPLWIIRNGAKEIETIKADKQPIGKYDNLEDYTTHKTILEKGDTIYIFSDGLVDQFGGEKGKKYKPAQFRNLLLSIQDKDMESQKSLILDNFKHWMGSEHEQIDDVCVIGYRF